MTEPTTFRGALMRFLILATNPKRFRWLTAWALMITAEWLSRLARKILCQKQLFLAKHPALAAQSQD
jgi:hypothetical protein